MSFAVADKHFAEDDLEGEENEEQALAMRATGVTSAELLQKIEQDREAEWRVVQPELARFRASEAECAARVLEKVAVDKAVEAAKMMDADLAQWSVFGERLAQGGRERTRFDRWQQARRLTEARCE